MSRRVVVTGLGAVTPVGNSAPATWEALLAGRSGIDRITLWDPSPYSVQIAGEVKNFDPGEHVDRKALRRLDRNVPFAVAAAKEAQADAGLKITSDNANDVGVIVGTAIGGLNLTLDSQKLFEERGPNRLSPFFLQNLIPDAASGQVAIELGAKGPNVAIVSACATGSHSIGEAMETIRRGDAEVMIVGGTESVIIPMVIAGFAIMRILASGDGCPARACRPFDLNRQGFVVSEGAGMMVLETEEHARGRDARIYAEVVGYGSTNDAFDLAAPAENCEGSARAMQVALRKACMRPEAIGYINPHGTGTVTGDKYETAAIKSVFGDHAKNLLISSTKSMTGHMMGATGAVEAMACILGLYHQIVPPTINYETPDPDCDLDYVPNVARPYAHQAALSNSIGLGGHNSAIIFKSYPEGQAR